MEFTRLLWILLDYYGFSWIIVDFSRLLWILLNYCYFQIGSMWKSKIFQFSPSKKRKKNPHQNSSVTCQYVPIQNHHRQSSLHLLYCLNRKCMRTFSKSRRNILFFCVLVMLHSNFFYFILRNTNQIRIGNEFSWLRKCVAFQLNGFLNFIVFFSFFSNFYLCEIGIFVLFYSHYFVSSFYFYSN